MDAIALRGGRLSRVALVSAISALAAAAIWLGLPRSGMPVVDMSRVESGATRPRDELSAPVLRVAVAAMTSPESTSPTYGALLEVIGARTGMRVVLVHPRTYAEANAMLEGRQVDVAFLCSGPYVLGKERFGLERLVTPVVRGSLTYHAYIIARAGGEIASVPDLRGKTFAFTDPDSNSGRLFALSLVATLGERTGSFFGETFYTGAHDGSIRAVAAGLADAASVDSLVWDYLDAIGSPETARTRIIARSPAFGNPPVVVHPAVEPGLKARLRQLFLGLHEDPDAAPLLEKLQIDRFEAAPDALYDSVEKVIHDAGLAGSSPKTQALR